MVKTFNISKSFKTRVILETWHREGPRCQVCSFAVRVIKGMVTPIKRSAKARDTMNLWNLCPRNLFDLKMTLTSTVFAKIMTIAVMILNIVFGDANKSNISNDSHPDFVSFSLVLEKCSPKRSGSRSSLILTPRIHLSSTEVLVHTIRCLALLAPYQVARWWFKRSIQTSNFNMFADFQEEAKFLHLVCRPEFAFSARSLPRPLCSRCTSTRCLDRSEGAPF